jgi:hypothetical protein
MKGGRISNDLLLLDLRAPTQDEEIDSKKRKLCMIYPSDRLHLFWEVLVSICLLTTCVLTPFTLAFSEVVDKIEWYVILNYSIDGFFFLDIIVNFISAYSNDNYELVSNRKEIACTYL